MKDKTKIFKAWHENQDLGDRKEGHEKNPIADEPLPALEHVSL